MENRTVLFSLIRAAVDNEFSFDSTNLSLTKEDYIQLFRLAKKHDICHLVAYGLKKTNLLPQNEELSKKFKQEYLVAAFRSEQMNIALNRAVDVFVKNSIGYILLKGTVLREFYPEKWMRIGADIDILIKEDDVKKAIEALAAQGFALNQKSVYDVSLCSANGVNIELHFNLMGYSVANQKSMLIDNVWEHSLLKGESQFVLSDEMFYFYHISHMAKHFVAGGCGIKPILDLWILNKSKALNTEKKEEMLNKSDLLTFENSIKTLSEVWFSDRPHTELTMQLEEYVLTGGVYGNLKNRVAIAQAQKGNKSKYLFSRVFVSYEELKTIFPVLNKHKWLFPFMQSIRWFQIIFTGRTKRSVKEIAINNSRTDEQIIQIKKLLKDIGL